MARVLLATHHPALTTSYARVGREFSAALVEMGHDVTVVGSAPPGVPPAGPRGFVPPDGLVAGIARTAAVRRPDLLVTIGDPWMFDGLDAAGARPACRWLACFPLDGGPVPRAWARWMSAADGLVTFSHFAAGLARAATGRDVPVLHHGVDPGVFAPRDRAAAKRRVVGEAAAFVVGYVGTNQQRKNLPALVAAFAAFAAGKPDALLYLHAPVAGHWDLEELTDRHGVTARTRATLNYDPHRGLADADLAAVYNAFDVLALPTMGEGFGLPLLEAAACGVPAVATDCSACRELLPDPAQRVRVKATLVMARNIEQAVVDEDDLAARLDALYREADLRARLGDAGRQLAMTLDWAGVRRRFAGIATAVLAARV